MTLRCEILSTGDEILTGMLVDTNAAYLAEQMGTLGFDVTRHTTIGDERAMLEAVFRALAASADVVLCTGGLGPTADDLTTEVAADILGVELKLDDAALAHMESLWRGWGRTMPENNRKQAMFPETAEVLPNPVGTAPGFTVMIGNARFFFMPGVPREMKKMFAEQVVPRLERLRTEPDVFAVRVYRSFGMTESAVDRALKGLEDLHSGVKLGFRAQFPEIQIKLAVKGADAVTARTRLAAAAKELLRRLGVYVFSDGSSLEEIVGAALARKQATLATAESSTGGMVAQMLSSVSGSSAYFDRAFVTGSQQAQHDILGVDQSIFQEHGAVSEACARAMAEGARARANTTYALAVTDAIGPGDANPELPVGLVYIALAAAEGTTVRRIRWPGPYDQLRAVGSMVALDLLRRSLLELSVEVPKILSRRAT